MSKKPNFRALTKYDIKDLYGRVEWDYNIRMIHKTKPDIVLLTQTSTIPFGFILKEAYEKIYPEDKVPRFLTIDVKAIRKYEKTEDPESIRGEYDKETEAIKRKLEKIGLKRKSNIVILDEFSNNRNWSGIGLEGTLKASKNVVQKAIKDLGVEDVRIEALGLGANSYPRAVSPWASKSYHGWDPGRNSADYEEYQEEQLKRANTPEERKIVRGNLKVFREIGRKVGKDLSGKRRPLEEKLSLTTAMTCIIFSLIFLSSNITGNSIANLDQTNSNWIGTILFILGLISMFFYFKRK